MPLRCQNHKYTDNERTANLGPSVADIAPRTATFPVVPDDKNSSAWNKAGFGCRCLPGGKRFPYCQRGHGEGGLAGRATHQSEDVENLYFAGDWVGSTGYLVDASLDSARASARAMLREFAASNVPTPNPAYVGQQAA